MFATILHVDLDAFFVAVEQLYNPSLKGKPVVVGGRSGGRGVVASTSYEARKLGVRSAMPVARARQLCPEAIFVQGNFDRYREASGRFMDIIGDFSPLVEPGGLDEAYVDITGTEFLFGPPRHLAKRLKYRVRNEAGLTASVGISRCKIVAKVASELGKPDGLIEVFPGAERDFLAPLSVGDLPGVGKKTEEILRQMGIFKIGQLATVPTRLLKERFGVWGTILSDHANGIDDRRVELPGEAKSISKETTFETDTLNTAFLEATLCRHCEKLGAELRSRKRLARCVTLKLRYTDFETVSRSLTLESGTDSDQVVFAGARELLEKTLTWKRKLVRLLGVEVSRLADGCQLSMLEPNARKSRMDGVLDRIRNKYGFDSIQSGRTIALRDNSDQG